MRFGVHLPQYGRAAGPKAIAVAARQAEALGFDDVWVYDHLAIPASVTYPKAYVYEPLMTLAFAAAVTERVGLGTSVLVLPYRHPVFLAKALASLDQLSEGRLILGVAVGWLEAEFAALGVPFSERGRRTDEAIDVLRACWEGDQPVTFRGPTVDLDAMKMVPAPAGRVPIWVGGTSDAALRRAVERGDGWHGAFLDAEAVAPIVRRLRADRPEKSFTTSVRVEWDGLRDDSNDLARRVEAMAEAGIQHIMSAPAQPDIDAWLRSVDALWAAFEPYAGR